MTRLFTLIALVITLFATSLSAQPTDLVTTHGRSFVHNGKTFEFVGVNLRGLSHYGHGQPLIYTTRAHATENIEEVARMNGKVIRLFAANKHHSVADNITHLTSVLDEMETNGLKAIICLTDVYTTDFHPAGDDSYYQMQPSGWTLLDDTWFAGGYEDNYLPWVEAVVTALKNHNAVFAWELGNEITDIKTPSNIIDFTKDVAAAIKAIDPYHMVTTGYLAVDHTQIGEQPGVDLYSDPNLDFMTVHIYNGEDHIENWVVNARVEKPIVLEEYGWNGSTQDRINATQSQVNYWFDQRLVDGFMQWGFQVQSTDIGDGDAIYGMDNNFFDDSYDEYFNIYKTRADALEAAATDPPAITPPPGTNVAPLAENWQADSTFNAEYGGDKAIDGIVSESSKWTSNGSASPHWLALDLGNEYEITGFVVKGANAAGELVEFAFEDYDIQSGPSISGPWTNRVSVDDLAKYSVRRFPLETPITARYIRILIDDPGTDNYARLTEFEIYSSTASQPEGNSWSTK